MIFNSVTYLLFLGVTVGLFWLLPKRPRLWLILLASSTFYGFWRPEFLAVMFLSAATDYFVALRMEATEVQARRRGWLLLSLGVNLGLLGYFKYLFFIVDNAVAVLNLLGAEVRAPALNIVLPLGISFYTFETISYVVDVYRRFIPAERSFVMYGCFVTFFPKLVAGPILRAAEMLPQFTAEPVFRPGAFVSGLRRIVFGLFLKVALADNLAPLVDDGFMQPIAALSALDVLTLAFLFGFQIYFDFSAYSSIAIGSARLMGIHVPENFNFPYVASSPRDFWRRWHISLSSWIRDYLYLPLLGVKVRDRSSGGLSVDVGTPGQATRHPLFALFMTWAIMGLWHGANWTFVLWGLYHASLIAGYRTLAGQTVSLPVWLRVWGGRFITLPLVMLGWIPFRAQSVDDALAMFAKLTSPQNYLWLGMRENTYLIAALVFLASFIAYLMHEYGERYIRRWIWMDFALETMTMSVVLALVFVFLRPINQFIYFQF
ncbi:putative alginate O-acetyltransferase [Methylococcus capsulatus str. Bath]|uniref:Probable alginate O-acetylase n=2 Tax=cellular organisms TaxID=131567 RepID=Q609R6_METCA|nr:MBOAT family O-acyltransferase [Methylococcus capsulatus]AAU92782.1 putative alginate O-acetyltransferase [Methylococcus capsulatus str. Bath]